MIGAGWRKPKPKFHWLLAGGAALFFGILVFVASTSSNRQVDNNISTCTIVITEGLFLTSPARTSGAVLGIDADRQISLTLFNSGNSSNLTLGLFANEKPGLSLRRDDTAKVTMITMSDLSTGPSVLIANRSTGAGLSLSVLGDGMASAQFSDANGPRMVVSAAGERAGAVGFQFNNTTGSRLANVNATDKLASLALFDSERHVRTLLGMFAGKSPSFFLYDRAIHPLIEIKADDQGQPVVRVNDFAVRKSKTIK